MTAGEVDLPKARVIVDGVAALDLDLARSIVATILPQAPGLTTSELRTRLSKLVIQADPDAAVKRHKARKRQRRVELHNTEDSCATLLGVDLPADDALAASNRLTEFARALKQAGDPRSIDQLRADTFLNLLLGKTCSQHTAASNHHLGGGQTGGGSAGSASAGSASAGSGQTDSGSTGSASTGSGVAGGDSMSGGGTGRSG